MCIWSISTLIVCCWFTLLPLSTHMCVCIGVGKSTLLRSMACRELRLPAGVSVLHVEQEVIGDDTLALDSVLECDTERTKLLAREAELLASGDSSR